MIRVLLADDHRLVLEGFAFILQKEDDIEVVGKAANGKEALEIIGSSPVDIAILDLDMPEMGGLKAARIILREYSKTKVMILTMHQNEELIEELISIGVSGFVLKNSERDEFINAIRTVHSGKKYYAENVSDAMMLSKSHQKTHLINGNISLTKRELQILKLIVDGLSTRQISEKLYIASSTVETHRRKILSKTKAGNSRNLIRIAIENGLA